MRRKKIHIWAVPTLSGKDRVKCGMHNKTPIYMATHNEKVATCERCLDNAFPERKHK